ncbi:SPOR domain-containing protein [Neobacillus mesonae]|uniref:SPOR domain-containing protein n=1 Tax=Neobacillus mesonae TaxID=1193713 RepID=A0A3Q9R0N5_9BACI|nr:SPOR domain-containing protein [Neobacillus mesonae]AZU63501.1 hypothetical protein CHR53_20755 [Neobacillus mesonae]
MDKPKKGTITIKINGDNKAYQEELRKGETKESSPVKDKIVELHPNKIEEDTKLEVAAAQENEEESFDWIIPESMENDEEDIEVPMAKGKGKGKGPQKLNNKKTVSFSSYYKKKNGKPISSILVTAVFAILIGTTIGVFMLKLLNGPPVEKTVTTPPVIEEPKKEDTKKPAAGTTSITIKQQTAFVVQGGVYGSKESADNVSNQLASLGVPTQTINMDDKFYIFLGVTHTIEDAKSLAAQYKANGVEDAFAKPFLLEEKNLSGLNANEKNFLDAIPTIYETLSLVTSGALLTNDLSEDGSSALAIIEKKLNTGGITNKKVTSLKSELQGADKKVKEFEGSKDAKSLKESQQHLLNFLAAYYSL